MAQRLTNLQIGEVSLVDAPANPGARAILFKRDFSAGERRADARSGAALPDGSFPIENGGDLGNAIRAIGRAKNPAAARKHIISRARSLGLTSKLPEGWMKKSLVEKLREFLFAEDEDVSADLVGKIDEAAVALRKSVDSIVADTELADKSGALDATFAEYAEHIQGVVPEALEGAISKRSSEAMTEEERKAAERKAKNDNDGDEMKKALDAALAELAVLKMGPEHRAYHAQLVGAEQAQFAALPVDKRAEHIAANPVSKSAEAQAIEKANKVAADALAEVAKLRDEQALVEVVKRVTALGGSVELAKALHAVAKADPAAAKVVEQNIAGLAGQVQTGKLFAEFGSSQGPDASSPEALMKALAAEVRKTDPAVKSEAAAIAKIAGMPEHREIWNAYKSATTAKAA